MSETPPKPPRFSWPVRLLIFILLFDIIFRSLAVMVPWDDWISELDMERRPSPLPTRKEIRELADKADGQSPSPLGKEVGKILASTRDYFNPLPSDKTRAHLDSWNDQGKYTVAWLASRLEFMEHVVGVDERWPMFSPNVSHKRYVTRVKLIFADGSEQLVRQLSEPEDITCFFRWNQEKILDYETKAVEKPGQNNEDECWGYCNLLRHRFPHNDRGSPLKEIRLYEVFYVAPPPGADAAASYHEQIELTRNQTCPQARRDFYAFDPNGDEGRGKGRLLNR
jgi:hypothetical protein